VPSKLPIDRGVQFDPITGKSIVWNVGDKPTPVDFVEEQLPYCPVDADPYLPWIHDVFFLDGNVQFIAQNKRRCRTGKAFGADLERLEPQVALLQSVSVQRISNEQAKRLAPELWRPPPLPPHPSHNNNSHQNTTRYRLVPYDEADADGMYTRFVCRFHTWTPPSSDIESSSSSRRTIGLGETLSEYPFNYELASFRKSGKSELLSRMGKDNGKFWTSTLMFSCPLPEPLQETFQKMTKSSSSSSLLLVLKDDDIPLLHVDVIPIRTPPRYPINGFYLNADLVGPQNNVGAFDPVQAWGNRNVLPHVQASGRWENVPVCPIPSSNDDDDDEFISLKNSDAVVVSNRKANTNGNDEADSNIRTMNQQKKKPHLLSACLWASASFRTRGEHVEATTDTKTRLIEWIEFHLLVGFDHIYVYDNSGAHTNETNLAEITNLYSQQHVTRIDWPSVVCNNNIPAHDNTGERSSQYAAENSCRTRYAPRTEWMASFDTDEYLVPMGTHTSLRQVVEQAKDTNILSFRSSRGKLRVTASE
jgi:hypothetical protein